MSNVVGGSILGSGILPNAAAGEIGQILYEHALEEAIENIKHWHEGGSGVEADKRYRVEFPQTTRRGHQSEEGASSMAGSFVVALSNAFELVVTYGPVFVNVIDVAYSALKKIGSKPAPVDRNREILSQLHQHTQEWGNYLDSEPGFQGKIDQNFYRHQGVFGYLDPKTKERKAVTLDDVRSLLRDVAAMWNSLEWMGRTNATISKYTETVRRRIFNEMGVDIAIMAYDENDVTLEDSSPGSETFEDQNIEGWRRYSQSTIGYPIDEVDETIASDNANGGSGVTPGIDQSMDQPIDHRGGVADDTVPPIDSGLEPPPVDQGGVVPQNNQSPYVEPGLEGGLDLVQAMKKIKSKVPLFSGEIAEFAVAMAKVAGSAGEANRIAALADSLA